MSPTVIAVVIFIVLLVGGSALGLRAVWRGVAKEPSMRALAALRRAPKKAIRDVVDGEVVRLVGKAVAIGPLARAPLSARACVAHHVRVEDIHEMVSQGSTTTVRNLVVDECGGQRALVRVAGAIACLEASERCGEATYESAHDTPALAALLRANRLEVSGRHDAQEGIVAEGELVAVCGKASWRESSGDEVGGYRGRSRQLVIADDREVPVCVGNVLRALE
jgi:hypothetical protein